MQLLKKKSLNDDVQRNLNKFITHKNEKKREINIFDEKRKNHSNQH